MLYGPDLRDDSRQTLFLYGLDDNQQKQSEVVVFWNADGEFHCPVQNCRIYYSCKNARQQLSLHWGYHEQCKNIRREGLGSMLKAEATKTAEQGCFVFKSPLRKKTLEFEVSDSEEEDSEDSDDTDKGESQLRTTPETASLPEQPVCKLRQNVQTSPAAGQSSKNQDSDLRGKVLGDRVVLPLCGLVNTATNFRRGEIVVFKNEDGAFYCPLYGCGYSDTRQAGAQLVFHWSFHQRGPEPVTEMMRRMRRDVCLPNGDTYFRFIFDSDVYRKNPDKQPPNTPAAVARSFGPPKDFDQYIFLKKNPDVVASCNIPSKPNVVQISATVAEGRTNKTEDGSERPATSQTSSPQTEDHSTPHISTQNEQLARKRKAESMTEQLREELREKYKRCITDKMLRTMTEKSNHDVNFEEGLQNLRKVREWFEEGMKMLRDADKL
ncbi:hypothetical protein BJ508DRAFT_313770 [Ascobolus immersus RN42]|uniref:Uncharacterized protein n=1 Tax=Ascobolus immersus RN42 TaxID=1160509 RepID=A0A3N4HKN0_ASCIM|nr:hypothetical protein BJ508DRAFT_313770 [Ascobolus immersus RN42]